MHALLPRLRQRLAQRQDSEHGQQIVRIALITLILAYVLLPGVRNDLPHDQYVGVLAIVLTGLTLSLGAFGWLLWRPQRSDPRRVLGMLADYGLIAAGMVQMGEPLAWVYIVVMWVTVGNGMRFGNNYLYVAVAMAMASFGCTALFTAYWVDNARLAFGLWLGLAAVPLYFSTLLRQLTQAMAEARRASEAKSRFLANMSHEFRTPLNGLAGMTEVLATTELDDEQRECLSTIQASSRSLLALVEEVLDISAIEAGKLRVVAEDFALADVMQAIGLILLPQARAKRLDYRVRVDETVPPRLRGDTGHLRQVLLNLAGNAVKFTDHGRVEIRVGVVSAESAGGVRLRFEITDTGIGVPLAMRPRLFEAFEQADVSMARRHEGTGLGTTIAKGLVEAMGGEIGYEAHLPQGSRFWFEVPFAPPLPVHGEATPAVVGQPREASGNVIAFADPFLRHRARVRSMSILVADDHEANRMVLQRLLQKAGHRVLCVNGGEAVLDAMAETDFDAAIVDLHMPGMSGLDMLKELRVMQAGGGPRTPVLVLSADVTPEAIQRCTQAGAHTFLAKPVVAVRLLDTLADIASNGDLKPSAPIVRTLTSSTDGVLDPGVLDELSALGMGDGFEREFVRQCLGDAESCMRRAHERGEALDWPRFRDEAHAIKGVASNLGLVRAANRAGELMRMADWQLKAEWRQRLSVLAGAINEGRLALDARAVHRSHRGVDEADPR
mgnify:CR=1 FL=1